MSRTVTLPDQLYSRLAAEARSEGLGSVEEWLQKLAGGLHRQVGQPASVAPEELGTHPAVIGHTLDRFMGDWTEAEEREFSSEVAIFDQIDESLWK